MEQIRSSLSWNKKNKYYLETLGMIDHRNNKILSSLNISGILNDVFSFAMEKGMEIKIGHVPTEQELQLGWCKLQIHIEKQKREAAEEEILALGREVARLIGADKELDEVMEKIKEEVRQ